ncbi:MAG: SDR family NAD(P)-dependent oxidoreductase [Micromonosporaceae bacterium]|nr:SDR family NAD(P)-dependent oxidoreductase [Micromonosporaceae bacterium]
MVVTGANSGVGLAAAVGFARSGGRVALVGRDQERLDAAVAQVRQLAGAGAQPTGYRADFASLAEVRKLAEALRDGYPSIDVLANNAGGVNPRRVTTVDGHELTMEANHLAPFLLTHLLRDRLGAAARVVNTASDAHRAGRLDPKDLDSTRRYRSFVVYGSSKQANILFAAEAARRWPEILSFSYHPGVVRSRFGRANPAMRVFYRFMPGLVSPEGGADTLLWLAGAPADQLTNGGYYAKRRLRQPTRPTGDPKFAAQLWEASTAAVGLS